MSGNVYIVAKVGNELTNALSLREALDGEDPQLVLDCIEGETELHEALCVVVECIGEEEMMLAGIETKLTELGTRAGRIKATIEKYRDLIARTMERAGIKTIKSPTATISLRSIAPKVIVKDEAEILERAPHLFVTPKPKLDMAALKEAMATGDVAGADWSNGGTSITIRRQ